MDRRHSEGHYACLAMANYIESRQTKFDRHSLYEALFINWHEIKKMNEKTVVDILLKTCQQEEIENQEQFNTAYKNSILLLKKGFY